MRIPNILHFCFGLSPTFGDKPWSLLHHVSVVSAIDQIKPDAAYLYYEYEPSGPWWELSRKLLTPIRIDAPREVFGNPLRHPAHRADIVRLQKLLDIGGIYLDADVFVHRSFEPLLNNSAVLGQEGEYGLANAVILAEPHAEFLQLWYDSYRQFRSKGRDEYWNEHSVKVPAILAKRYPSKITTLPPKAFFWPRWHRDHLKMIYGNDRTDIVSAETYATHLWETHAWTLYVENLTPGYVRRGTSNFCLWARPYVADLPDTFGSPSATERMVMLYRKPRRLVRTLSQKVMRGGRIMLRGRGAPTL
jgi:hypothetical protein